MQCGERWQFQQTQVIHRARLSITERQGLSVLPARRKRKDSVLVLLVHLSIPLGNFWHSTIILMQHAEWRQEKWQHYFGLTTSLHQIYRRLVTILLSLELLILASLFSNLHEIKRTIIEDKGSSKSLVMPDYTFHFQTKARPAIHTWSNLRHAAVSNTTGKTILPIKMTLSWESLNIYCCCITGSK